MSQEWWWCEPLGNGDRGSIDSRTAQEWDSCACSERGFVAQAIGLSWLDSLYRRACRGLRWR